MSVDVRFLVDTDITFFCGEGICALLLIIDLGE